MRTRRSVRNQDRLFKDLFKPESQTVEQTRSPHLDMTDEEIDRAYYLVGKADRTRMKKQAEQERLRKKVVLILQKELQSD